ncbi:MAG: hypothetical protein RIQ93_484 [Verrucomicrobiota bacterium]|jgi:hypothetical protein
MLAALALMAREIRGRIGYVTDVAPDSVLNNAARAEDYYLAQFVLPPACSGVGSRR